MNQVEEIVRRAYAAFAVGDIETVLSVLSPEIRWSEAVGGPYGGVYVGPQQVVENVFMKLGGEWEGYSATPHEFVASGDTVVALGEYRGMFKATGKPLKVPFAHVWQFRDGHAVSFEQFTDTALHLAAMEHRARELATPGNPAAPGAVHEGPPASLDALTAAPDHHEVLLENDQVRVLDTRIRPGEATPVHRHHWPSVLFVLGWSDFVRRDADGTVVLDSRTLSSAPAPGSALWSGPLGPHSAQNVGERELRVIAVELKTEVAG